MNIEQHHPFVYRMMSHLNISVSQYSKKIFCLFFFSLPYNLPHFRHTKLDQSLITQIITLDSLSSLIHACPSFIYFTFFCHIMTPGQLSLNPKTRLLATIYTFLSLTSLNYHIIIVHLRDYGMNVCVLHRFVCWNPN